MKRTCKTDLSAAPRSRTARSLACVSAILASLLAGTPAAQAQPTPGAPGDQVYPPWQKGANNDAVDRGLAFTVPQVDDLADFHGDPGHPRLVLFVGGNYFFAMAPLVAAFEAKHPTFKGRIYWETIPPGLLIEQIKAHGRITSGNMTWTARADVYLAGLEAVRRQIADGVLTGPAVPYVSNTLTIMVPAGNPAHVTGLTDLGRADIRLAMPNPEFEGVARQIKSALRKAGGEALERQVYEAKVADGTTELTLIHHRQTPLFLMQGRDQAGVTWLSEAMFQEQIGHPISHVPIPDDQNATGVYAGAMVRGATHPAAARLWLQFIRSPEALAIFARYGFKPYVAVPDAARDAAGTPG
ncbi:MAG: substrate-binding domain-containing protein [Alphaproteobacteria bacterium]|nr:substrate-binding domain-containing protein [Alphaproteobacteria bacterium]